MIQDRMANPSRRHQQGPAVELAGRWLRTFIFATALAGCFYCQTALAQSTTGSMNGIVTDTTGAVIAGANVTATDLSTGAVRSAMTNSAGFYSLPGLLPGDYKVVATTQGFQQTTTDVVVALSKVSRWDVTLSPGQASSTITVTDAPARLDTQSHQLAATISARRIETLPAAGRTVFSTLTSATNVEPYSGGNDISYYHLQANSLIIGGSVYGTTGFLQDGVTNFNFLTKTANFQPAIEATKEVSVIRNGASAQFDSPNMVNVVTKGGTNHFHGRVYDYLRNDALDAIGEVKTIKPPLRLNQFGGNIGGPVLHNRLFFFFGYTGLRNSSSSVVHAIVPTVAERSGDFSALGKTIYDPSTYDPVTKTIEAFPGNQIPQSRFSPFATKYLAYYPLPTPSSVPGTNLEKTVSNTETFDSYLGRVDYTLGQHDAIQGAYMTTRPVTRNGGWAAVPLFDIEYVDGARNAYVQETHVFNSQTVNIARFGYNRSDIFLTQSGVGKEHYQKEFGLTALESTPLGQSAPPKVAMTSYSTLGQSTNPQGALQNLFQYADDLSLIRGRNTLELGFELDRLQFDGNWSIFNSGSFSFKGQYTSNHALKQAGGNGFADFLLGFPSGAEGGVGNSTAAFRQYNFMPYIQDNWRVTQRLTLNLGMRYDYYQSPDDKNGHSNIYDIYTNTNHPGTFHQNYKNFAPRLGFAYGLGNKTTIRGGYGIYYTFLQYNEMQFMMANLPNFALQANNYPVTQAVPIGESLISNPTGSHQAPFTLALNMPTSYVQERNLSVEHLFGRHLTAEIAYIGSGAFHMMRRMNPNQAFLPADPSSPEPLQQRRPYSWVGDVFQVQNSGAGNYNGLEGDLRGNFGQHAYFFTSFVYSKALDNVTSEETTPLNSHDTMRDYALSDYNQGYVYKLGGQVELPLANPDALLLPTNNVVAREVLGGWSLSGVFAVKAGQPFSVSATDLTNTGAYHATRANRSCNGNDFAQRSRSEWFNTSCYSQPEPYEFGSEPRNDLVGPRNTSANMSLFKNFLIHESTSLQFRADAFGVFNHPLPNNPNANVNRSNNGIITSYDGARYLQLSLKLLF